MKHLYLCVAALAGISIKAQIVNIPDPVFKARLLAASPSNNIASAGFTHIAIDTNQDGEIQSSEALAVTALNVSNDASTPENQKISNLIGIAAFANLNTLACAYNLLTELYIGGLDLHSLHCPHNQITFIDTQSLVHPDGIDCSYNNLTHISFPDGWDALFLLDLSHNQLNEVHLPPAQPTWLDLSYNNLAYVDLTPCGPIGYFDYGGGVDLSHNPLQVLQSCYPGQMYFQLNLEATNLSTVHCTPANNSHFQWQVQQVAPNCTIDNTVCAALSVADFNAGKFAVFPNPVSEMLYVNAEVSNVRILNVIGQEVRNFGHIRSGADISDLPSGVYFLTADSGSGEIVRRFVKK